MISDIFDISRGKVINKNYLKNNYGIYPVYSSQTANEGIFGYINTYAYDFESITWTTYGAHAGTVFYHNNKKFSITNVCGLLKVKENNKNVNIKFIYYFLRTILKKYVKYDTANPKIMSEKMADIRVSLPPLETQNMIVDFLDKFEAIVSDLTNGIPAEIENYTKLYEEYRSMLLSFNIDR